MTQSKRRTPRRKTRTLILACLAVGPALLAAAASRAVAAFTSAPTPWTSFSNNPGYTSAYTFLGQPISDQETSADTTKGQASVPPDSTDLASGSPTATPGIYDTPFYGYYDGGTPYDPNTPSTMNDDFLFFRMRLEGNPAANGTDFDSYHWNILLDVDSDGYKEFWVDLNGSYTSSGAYDQIRVLYDNRNNQEIADPAAARVAEFQARWDGLGNSHTRVLTTTSAISPGDTDYYIEYQVPLTAFRDLLGNQVLTPASPVAFVFSTGASNQNPLQKDFMMDLKYLGAANPIQFGDVVKLNGEPEIMFTDAAKREVHLYDAGSPVYAYVKDRTANTDPAAVETVTITVTDPATGDDEVLTLRESGPNTGVFTNLGGAGATSSTTTRAWIGGVIYAETSGSPGQLSWRVTFGGGVWALESSPDGATWTARGTVTAGTPFTYTDPGGWSVGFTLATGATPQNGDRVTFTTYPGDPLPTSTTAGGTDDDALFLVSGGDIVQFSYFPPDSSTSYTTEAEIRAPCRAVISFTRSNGIPAENFIITNSTAASDRIYVTVTHPEANTNAGAIQSISLRLAAWNPVTGTETAPPAGDLETALALAETGASTGVFRNAGLPSRVTDGTATQNDALWEDRDGGALQATYSYTCGGAPYTIRTSARLFVVPGGGRVYFVNAAGTEDVELYGSDQFAHLKVVDATSAACGSAPPTTAAVTVTLATPVGDSRTVTVAETAPGSGVYLLSADLVRLATYDGAYVAGDDVLEIRDGDEVTATYTDVCDGDAVASNNAKTDTAAYNAPPLLINEVMFWPGPGEPEFAQIYNASSVSRTLTGYSLGDTDGAAFTFPAFLDGDPATADPNVVLAPGEKAYVFFNQPDLAGYVFYDETTGTWYFFTGATASDLLGGPAAGNAETADQITLADAGGTVVDYVGWSAVLAPSLDFRGDDASAVNRAIWTDDAYRTVDTITQGQVLARAADGFDTDRPSDWVYAVNENDWSLFVAVTPVLVSGFSAAAVDGTVLVAWETAWERGTLGFHLYRRGPAGRSWDRVNRALLPALIAGDSGGTYRFTDAGAATGVPLTYLIEEVSAGGRARTHGPWTVTAAEPRGLSLPAGGFARERRPPPLPRTVDTAPRAAHDADAEQEAAAEASSSPAPDALRIAIRENGLYFLSTETIAGSLGIPPEEVRALIRRGGLALSSRGREVSWLRATDAAGIHFYARGIDSLLTLDNVYWLAPGRGRLMASIAGSPPAPAPDGQTFTATRHAERDVLAMPAFSHDPAEDYWMWDSLIGGMPGEDSREFRFEIDGPAPSADPAAILVRMRGIGGRDLAPRHRALLTLNGGALGEHAWEDGATTCSLAVPAGLLVEGENVLGVTAAADASGLPDIFLVDSIDVTYQRTYRASGGSLELRGGGNAVVTVGGLPGGGTALVLDLRDPFLPRRVAGARVEDGGGEAVVSFAPARADRTYFVASTAAARTPADVRPSRRRNLRDPQRGTELVVVVPEGLGLRPAADALASYRRGQGLTAQVVSLDAVYREFTGGLAVPQAIARFLARAWRAWTVRPRYAVLVGTGSYDYRGLEGQGVSPTPTLMVRSPQGLVTSDAALGDVDGDGIPEIAVGRIPALSASELDAYLAKVRVAESAPAALRRRTVWVADDPDDGGDFPADSAAVAALRPARFTAREISLGATPAAEAKAALLGELAAGAGYVNYLGHAAPEQIAEERILAVEDVPLLPASPAPPVFTAMTCALGTSSTPGFSTLSERLVLHDGGGAAAVWSPSGYSMNHWARALDRAFYRAAFSADIRRLGDAVRVAAERFTRRRNPRYLPLVYNLFGDPALRLPR